MVGKGICATENRGSEVQKAGKDKTVSSTSG